MKLEDLLTEDAVNDWKSYREEIKNILANADPDFLNNLSADIFKEIYQDFKNGVQPQEVASNLLKMFSRVSAGVADYEGSGDYTDYSMRQGERGNFGRS